MSTWASDWHDAHIDPVPTDRDYMVYDGADVWLVREDGYPKHNGCGCCGSKVYNVTHWAELLAPPEGKDS